MTLRKYQKALILFGLVLLAMVVKQLASIQTTPRVVFFDVGQGDATMISEPNNIQVIIDGGPDDTLVKKISHYLPPADRTIEAVILTHPDSDHLFGLIELARRYDIDYVLQTTFLSDTTVTQEWQALLKEKGIVVIDAIEGAHISLSDLDKITVLSPKKGVVYKDVNAQSIICLYEFADTKMLFLGDATPESQDALRGLPGLDNIRYVKISHHGSEKSYSEDFINALNPTEAIIQVGAKNNFGHPSPAVIKNLEKKNIKVRRTDQEEDVVVLLRSDREPENNKTLFEKIKILWYNMSTSINLSPT